MEPTFYEPQVIKNREFKEIASDFANPLEAIREAISNALDAGATEIRIVAENKEIDYKRKLVLTFGDNGSGMNLEKLHAFFDLGNSQWSRQPNRIGEKGHGTKIYYHSEKLSIKTFDKNGEGYEAEIDQPWIKLKKEEDLKVKIIGPQKSGKDTKSETTITIIGFFENKVEPFGHERMKDYVKWFTAFGSIKPFFETKTSMPKLFIKGVDKDEFEEIPFRHPFPKEKQNFKNICDEIKKGELKGNITDHFCKIWCEEKTELHQTVKAKVQIVFAIEGEKVRIIPKGVVSATDRYGLWLAKAGIPIERKNDWLFPDKAVWTQFHIIANCDDFQLTANRGSVGNSDPEVMEAVKKAINEFYEKIQKENVYKEWEDLKEAEELEAKKKKEYETLQKRLKKIEKREHIKEITQIKILKPGNEGETLHLLSNLIVLNKLGTIKIDGLDFEILDVESKTGIDLIVSRIDPATQSETYKIVEVEHKLENFTKHKHFFKQVHAIVCWEKGKILPGNEIVDMENNKYELVKTGGKYFFQNKADGSDTKGVYILSEMIKVL